MVYLRILKKHHFSRKPEISTNMGYIYIIYITTEIPDIYKYINVRKIRNCSISAIFNISELLRTHHILTFDGLH